MHGPFILVLFTGPSLIDVHPPPPRPCTQLAFFFQALMSFKFFSVSAFFLGLTSSTLPPPHTHTRHPSILRKPQSSGFLNPDLSQTFPIPQVRYGTIVPYFIRSYPGEVTITTPAPGKFRIIHAGRPPPRPKPSPACSFSVLQCTPFLSMVFQCDVGVSVNSMYYQLYRPPTKIMMLGTGCSSGSEATAMAAQYWNLIQVCYRPNIICVNHTGTATQKDLYQIQLLRIP